jgi:hypothetical protein
MDVINCNSFKGITWRAYLLGKGLWSATIVQGSPSHLLSFGKAYFNLGG